MTKDNKKVSLTEEDLRQLIANTLQESLHNGELQEAWTDYMKGAGQAIGNKFKNAGKSAYNSVKNAGQKIGNAVGNAAKNVGNAVNKQVQDVKTAGERASMQADNGRIANQLQQWYKEGRFGNNRQAASYIQGLINAMNANFNAKYGQPQQ